MYTKANMYEAAHKVPISERILILSFLKKSMTENKLILSVFTHLFLKLAVQCMTQEEVAVIYISQAQELEAQGKYKEAERWFTLLSIPDCRPSLPILPRLAHPTTIPPSLRLTRFFTCVSLPVKSENNL